MTDVAQMSKSQRIASLVGSAILLFGLLIATYLQPDSRGHGTHQQLGLPPCTFEFLLHFPCPACGMTTSWAYAVRGQWQQSIQVNLGGFVFFLLAAMSVPTLVAAAILGRSPWPGLRLLAPILLASALFLALIQWAVRILV